MEPLYDPADFDQHYFEQLMEAELQVLPARFKNKIENLIFLVEDYPNPELVQRMGLPGRHSLLGVYTGVPLSKRHYYMGVMPDQIILFRCNILSVCRRETEIPLQIRKVLLHEIGHYLGMSEAEIREVGY